MNAILVLSTLLLTQAPAGDAPATEAPAAAQPAPAAETPAPAAEAPAAAPEAAPAAPAPEAAQPAPEANVPRASDRPLSGMSPEQKVGRIVSGVALGIGAVLVAAGLAGLGSAAAFQFSPWWPNDTKAEENPRRTMVTIASAIAAGGLMLGLTCVLGGAFGIFVG